MARGTPEDQLGRLPGARLETVHGDSPQSIYRQRPREDMRDSQHALTGRRLGGRPLKGLPSTVGVVHRHEHRAGVLTLRQKACSPRIDPGLHVDAARCTHRDVEP